MKKFFTAIVLGSVAIPALAQTQEWRRTVNLDEASETYTLETSLGTCSISYGDDLMVQVKTRNGVVHRGYYTREGATPAGREDPVGSPVRAFRLADCGGEVSNIASEQVRCWYRDVYVRVTVTYGPIDIDQFRCPERL